MLSRKFTKFRTSLPIPLPLRLPPEQLLFPIPLSSFPLARSLQCVFQIPLLRHKTVVVSHGIWELLQVFERFLAVSFCKQTSAYPAKVPMPAEKPVIQLHLTHDVFDTPLTDLLAVSTNSPVAILEGFVKESNKPLGGDFTLGTCLFQRLFNVRL